MVKPYLNKVGGEVQDDVSLFTGGLNYYQDKAFLEADQMPYVMNMQMKRPPQLTTRPSRRTWASEFHDVAEVNQNPIINIFAISEDDILVITKQERKAYLERYVKELENGLTRFRKYTIGEIPAPGGGDGYSGDYQYYFAYCPIGTNRYVYIGNEHTKLRIDLNESPTNIRTYLDHFGIPVWHKGRLWLARPSENIVEWSNALEPDNFIIGYEQTPPVAGDSGEVYVNGRKGQLQTIVSYDDKLMIFCEHSVHAVYGNSGIPTDENYFQVVDVMNNLGLLTPKSVAVGGGRLYWLGDDYEVYEYTGASFRMVSRPGKSRNETISVGGISGLIKAFDAGTKEIWGLGESGTSRTTMTATSDKVYLNIWNRERGLLGEKLLFVFDTYNRTWWCEDGEFSTIANYSDIENRILLAKHNGDILISEDRWDDTQYVGQDAVFDFDTNEIVANNIEYEFHTRVYGADGTDLRETLSDVWFQARANANVYITDVWTSFDKWKNDELVLSNLVKIGELKNEYQEPLQPTRYREDKYEQQVCYVEKMYGQRLNTFQIVVQGEGNGIFYLMKREWRAR